ncbi:YIP1 family protein [Ruegeria arenilitoris]|uniref:YIP1 family protein n=1 Tax=Ruegeria arenilitoris TaxID=1173585 RepID=UPI00147A6C9B|nr:YIP1 family protein [Ruegeria arenilitoris]
MPVTSDIVATYRGPGRVVRRLLEMGPREDRVLAFVMIGCALVFIGHMPLQARTAHLMDQELNSLLAGSLYAWLLGAPLLLYLLAGISHLILRMFGGSGDWYGARLALFWAFLAASPVMLLRGLVAGFIGPGLALNCIGAAWWVVFLWFWLSGLRQTQRRAE